MSSFTGSARKYRPQAFAQLRGQEGVVRALQHALREDRIGQAILLWGPSGSGKTSSARIVAKTINCHQRLASGDPCGVCPSCQEIAAQKSMNVYELDAASHNSVDDIRALLEQLRYRPAAGKKVFIIDEVHMLSVAAFNALLKVLEEPADYLCFILATTEYHKVLPTVRSRCQVFEFRAATPEAIFAELQAISEQEGISAQPEALQLIAQRAEGSFREALHEFDKLVTARGSGSLTYGHVCQYLNIVSEAYVWTLTKGFAEGDVKGVIALYHALCQQGMDGHDLLLSLCRHFLDLLICSRGSVGLLQLSPDQLQLYTHRSAMLPAPFLKEALFLLEQGELHYKERRDKRLFTEILLVKLCLLGETQGRIQLDWPGSMEPPPQAAATRDSKAAGKKPVAARAVARGRAAPAAAAPAAEAETHTLPAQAAPAKAPSPTPPPAKHAAEEAPADYAQWAGRVQARWQQFLAEQREKKHVQVCVVLSHKYRIEEDGTIILPLTNPLQQEQLAAIEKPLLACLAAGGGVPALRLMTELAEPGNILPDSESAAEWEKLVQKNPAIGYLHKALGLEAV